MCDIHVVILCVLSETWHYKLCLILSLDKVLALLPLFPQLLRLRWLVLVPPLLPVVELGEAVADDGDGEADDEDAEDGAEAAENFPKTGHWTYVPVSHLWRDGENRYEEDTGDEVEMNIRIAGCQIFSDIGCCTSVRLQRSLLWANVAWDYPSQVNFISPSIGHVWSMLGERNAKKKQICSFWPQSNISTYQHQFISLEVSSFYICDKFVSYLLVNLSFESSQLRPFIKRKCLDSNFKFRSASSN